MQKEYIDRILGTVILNESNRARSVSIRVSRTEESVTLTYPTAYNLERAIRFLEEKREKILSIQRKQQAMRAKNPPATSYDESELRIRAKAHLPQRIAQIAQQVNIKYNKVSIRATRTKWGSCSSDNNISLSIYLMILPQHLIDFVILHELCHTVHHNHSPKFHALLNYICQGREKELNRELKQYSIR